jgi:carbohydrate-binding DOMON domain-containing protein
MPIWLRKFTFHKIEKWYSEENEVANKANQGNSTQVVSPDGKINVPEFLAASKQYKQKTSNKSPTYSTKALRK